VCFRVVSESNYPRYPRDGDLSNHQSPLLWRVQTAGILKTIVVCQWAARHHWQNLQLYKYLFEDVSGNWQVPVELEA
jgi:hypothetical protein